MSDVLYGTQEEAESACDDLRAAFLNVVNGDVSQEALDFLEDALECCTILVDIMQFKAGAPVQKH